MYQKILHFIKYNNAFTIILAVFFLGFGVSFAADEGVRKSVYASEDTVISIDNGAIVNADLANFNFNLRIDSVTEDDKNYYATYSYQTLLLEDGVWQNRGVSKVLKVSKEALEGRDLGLYVAKELGENINYELAYLQRVQKLEREKGESRKVVTTQYSGLIGKMLDPKEQVIEGYSPVIPEPVKETATVESNAASVIVSTPYYEPSDESENSAQNTTATPSSDSLGGATTSEPPSAPAENPQPATEPATTTPATEPLPEPVSTSSPQATPLPEPEEMIDEELVQEVVEELLNAPASAEDTTPPVVETAPAPEPTP